MYLTVLVMNRQHYNVLKMKMLTVSTEVRLNSELIMAKISDCFVRRHRAKRVKCWAFIPPQMEEEIKMESLCVLAVVCI